MTVSVCWFRRDLRLADNRALTIAASDGEVVALFVADPVFDRAGPPRRVFLARTLRTLGASTDDALVIRRGDPADVVAQVAEETGARVVYAAADFGPYGRRRDESVRRRLAAAGVELRLVDSPYAVDPGRVTKDDGNPYAVFTPFSRAWEKAGWERPIPAPGSVTWRRAASDPIGPEPADSAVLPAPGEAAAHALADEFLETGIGDYADDRNRPDFPGTSRLSPYLRWGVLHPRQLLDRLGEGRGDRVFRSELAWREFYADVLWRRPETAWTSLQPKMRAMPVDDDLAARARFDRWAAGTTGYPIVDAGMRQLAATGWMHNRVRMVVASFLVKDLHLPWQWGAKFFMQRLVDGDLASNSHGWQWTAGTGTDAAPFFRVFNPVSQAEKFDPEGAYVRQWVPELRLVGDADVFAPWRAKGGLPLGALEPMVDHGAERVEALRRYAQVSGQ